MRLFLFVLRDERYEGDLKDMSTLNDTLEKNTKFKNIKAVVDYDAMELEGEDIVLIHQYLENTKTGYTEFEDDFEEDPDYTLKQFNKDWHPGLNDTVKHINQQKYLTGKITGCKTGEVLMPDGKCKKLKRRSGET